MRPWRVLACCVLLCFVPALAAAQPTYTLTDLGPALTVAALSQRGVPVGSILSPESHQQTAALLLPSGAREIAFGRADGIFDQLAVGYTSHGPVNMEAFAWTPQRGLRFLGLLPGGALSAAVAVNGLAVVVGYADSSTQAIVPTVFWLGQRWTLPLPHGGDGHAAAISPFGRIVGDADTGDADETFHATLWEGKKVTDLGTLGGPFSSATGVSDRPLVVGWSDTAPPENGHVGFVWTPSGGMVALPTLNTQFPFCQALSVNAERVVVGVCLPRGDGTAPSHAVRWEAGTLQDLQATAAPPDWRLERATGINNAGQIAGIGRFQGQSHAWLLTPQLGPMARR